MSSVVDHNLAQAGSLAARAPLSASEPSVAVAERAPPRREASRRGAADAEVDVAALYRKHHRLVFHLGLRYGRGDVAWAEDVTQEVFIDLFRAIKGLRDRDDLEGWLYRATSNRCLNRLRRERFLALAPVRWLLGEQQAEPAIPEALAIARDDLRRVFTALSALPPKEQVAFAMYHLDGKEQDEIGRTLGHSKSYVCKLIQRAEGRVRALGWEVGDARAR